MEKDSSRLEENKIKIPFFKDRFSFVVALLTICIAVWVTADWLFQCYEAMKNYQQAIVLIEEESYTEAMALLDAIEADDYPSMEVEGLTRLCKSHIYYTNGELSNAYVSIYNLKLEIDSNIIHLDLYSFREIVTSEYLVYAAAEKAAEEAAYEEMIRTGVPFVGMSESRIADTSLGAPSETVRHNTELINNTFYTANIYDFLDGDTVIFTARCIEGEVTQVWDKRDSVSSSSTGSSSNSSSSSGSGSSSSKKDPYNASSYKHADDFYYDHYDDFYDYEEAEKYWKAHK